jgi:hypothetical protein
VKSFEVFESCKNLFSVCFRSLAVEWERFEMRVKLRRILEEIESFGKPRCLFGVSSLSESFGDLNKALEV